MAAGATANAAAALKQIKKAVSNATTACMTAVANNVNKAAKQATSIWFTSNATLKSAVRGAIKAINDAIANIIKAQATALANVKIGGKRSMVRTLKTLVAEMIKAVTAVSASSMRQAIANMSNRPMLQGYIKRQLKQVVKDAVNAIVAVIRASILSGIANMGTRGISRAMGSLIAAAIRNALRNYQFPNYRQPPGGRGGRGGRGGGGGGDGMMGSRADVYMHSDVLSGIVDGAKNFVQPFVQVENATMQMEVFTGSADKAKAAVEELQKFAVESPYKLTGVLDSATTMMLYGQSTEDAIRNTKLLGDVAAGNTHKLELLALAMGQASALGRLQGQELRQMVNAGFNPLKVAATELAGGEGADPAAIQKKYDMLSSAMRAGKIDAKIIDAALSVATAKGGNYAGLSDKMAGGLGGLASQVIETFDLIRVAVTDTFAPELKAAIKEVKRYGDAIVGWIKANKQTVKEVTNLAIQVLKLVVAFHALGFMIAWVRWMSGTFRTVVTTLGGIIGSLIGVVFHLVRGLVVLTGAIRSFASIAMLAGFRAAIAWAAAAAPLWLLPALIIGISVLLAGLAHQEGFSGLFKDALAWGSIFLGFFWNLGHNLKNIFTFIGANWQVLIYDMIFGLNPFMVALQELIALILKPFGMDKDFRASMEKLRSDTVSVMGGSANYDTSMLKLNGPSFSGMGEGISSALGIDAALAPFMPKDEIKTPRDRPDVNFNDFIRGGADGGLGKNFTAAPDHAVRGSSDHAVRMYEYGEKARASQMAAKETHEKKTETLLSKIEANTRPKTPTMNGGTLEEAGLNLGGML